MDELFKEDTVSTNNFFVLTGRLKDAPITYDAADLKATVIFTLVVEQPPMRDEQDALLRDERGYVLRQADDLLIRAYGKFGETMSKHLIKGRLIALSGAIHTRRVENVNEAGKFDLIHDLVAEDVRFVDR
jgi:single-stranded DNA-binding protein